MKRKPLITFLLFSNICAAQSTLTLPDVSGTQSAQPPGQLPPGPATAPPQRAPQQPETGVQYPLPLQPSTRFVGPLTTKTEFQQFAEDTAGRRLPVYGRRLFDQVPTTFAPVDQIPVPDDYVIGPGDEILIRIWGKIDLDSRIMVDRNGQISLPKVGTLNVAGLHFNQLEDRIRSAVSALYRDFQINVTLGRLRSIQIYVLGSARRPGAYTVGSLSTLVNALFASGGPSATGSMRHIQLRRENQTITEFDIYDLLRDGDKSHDVQLLPGDVIYIPPIGPQIAIFGSVKDPGIYELRGDERIDSALHAAGGISALADTQKAVVEHILDHKTRSIDEFALDAAGLERPVQDGDILKIQPLSPRFENSVTLRGNVAQPGRYPWHEGMRISDLIPNRDSLISRDYWNRKNHVTPPDPTRPFSEPRNARLQQQAEIGAQMESEFRASDVNNQRPGQGAGQTQNLQANPPRPSSDSYSDTYPNTYPDTYSEPDSETYSNQNQNGRQRPEQYNQPQWNPGSTPDETPTIATVGKISAEINWQYAVIERLDERDLSTHLIPFHLASAVDDHSSADDHLLKPGDVVTIFSRDDLELPMEKHASFVRIGGEVNAPGVYGMKPGDTLQDLVQLAGGLTSHSDLYASKFTRLSVRRTQEEQLRESSEQMQRDLMSRYANAVPTTGQTGADQQAQMMMQQAAIARISAIKPTGRVVLQIKPTASTVGDIPPLPLEDGDTYYVPPRLSTVQVAGAVYNPNAFRYQEGKRLGDYLKDSGGPTREADKRRVFVIRADGTVVSKQAGSHFHEKFENLKLQPGDAIVVPEKLKTPGSRALQDTVGIISQSAITAAALSTVLP